MLEDYRLPVTDQGVIVPKVWFGAAKEVLLREVDGHIQMIPVDSGKAESAVEPFSPDDPIWQLGKHPVRLGISDGSVNLDQYLYGNPHRVEE